MISSESEAARMILICGMQTMQKQTCCSGFKVGYTTSVKTEGKQLTVTLQFYSRASREKRLKGFSDVSISVESSLRNNNDRMELDDQ